jgi:hypothetical protein
VTEKKVLTLTLGFRTPEAVEEKAEEVEQTLGGGTEAAGHAAR